MDQQVQQDLKVYLEIKDLMDIQDQLVPQDLKAHVEMLVHQER